MESISCGTPVACFDIGGNSDMISHQVNGYLARAFEPSDMANGIDLILSDANNKVFSDKARSFALNNFSDELVTPRYIELYNRVLD
jgi:glycosyltransferase involved in cell wall biosynthesis